MADINDPSNAEEDLTKGAGKKFNDVKSSINVDIAAVTKLDTSLKAVLKTVEKLRDAMKEASEASASMVNSAGGPQTGYNPGFVNTSQQAPTATGSGGGGGGGGFLSGMTGGRMGGGMAGVGSMLAIGSLFGAFSGMTGGLGGRMDRGATYASSVSKLNLQAQQMYGITQDQAMRNRAPLFNYRIGPGGANALQSFQFNTGVSASGMAPQVAGMMAASGYTLQAQDVLGMQEALMRPEVANRMFRFGGSVYGAGGTVGGPMDVTKDMVRRLGLADRDVLRGAMRPGSVTRGQLSMFGVPEEMQTSILQYAQQQVSFQERGGRGMYDPSKKSHRERMGVEGAFATEQQESTRLRELREETYTDAHLDHMSKAERQNQRVIEVLTNIEKMFADQLGVAVSNRPLISGGSRLLTGAGSAMLMGGLAAGPAGAPFALAGGISLLAGTALGMAGDPMEGGGGPKSGTRSGNSSSARDGQITIPVGYGGGRATLEEVKSRSDFKKMHPKMQERMLSMFRENPNLGIGGGWRDPSQQRAMFLDRYRPTNKKTGIKYDGKYWERVKGAPAAPPGRSMHEIGLAADLIGDLDWLQANASRFGLKTFADVNNEPWHIQPAELPNSRREYEENGSSWGSDGGYDPNASFESGPGGSELDTHSGSNSYGGTQGPGIGGLAGLTINQMIEAMYQRSSSMLGTGGSNGTAVRKSGRSKGGGSSSPVTGEGAMLAAKLAYDAGFRGEDLYKIVAIAGRESEWRNVKNPNTSDTGIWQINWSAHKHWLDDIGITERDQLLNGTLNAKAAFKLFKSSGWFPWRASESSDALNGRPGWDPNGDEMWNTSKFKSQARAAVDAVTNSGDPMERRAPAAMGGGGTFNMKSSPIHVEATFNISGTEGHNLEEAANTLFHIIEDKANTYNMRSA